MTLVPGIDPDGTAMRPDLGKCRCQHDSDGLVARLRGTGWPQIAAPATSSRGSTARTWPR